MRWDDLPVFLAALRGGSLATAGEALGIDASTVSRRLRTLEKDLELTLFDRTPGGLLPTESAVRLQPLAEQVEAAVAALEREGDSLEQEVEGEVRIACPDGVATELMPAVLLRLQERYPKVVPTLLCGISYVDLNRREADLALRTTNPPGEDLVTVRVAEVEVGIYGSPELVERWSGREPQELPWITWASAWEHLADAQWIQSIGGRVVLRASTLPAHTAAARAGLGFVIGTATEGLEPLVQSVGVTGSLWMTTHRTQRRVPRVDAVWNTILEVARDTPR